MPAPTDARSSWPCTLKDIAAKLGLSHEALYRSLAALECSGAIKRGKSRIVLTRGRKA
jgi:CRP-like cAMP-binding protein